MGKKESRLDIIKRIIGKELISSQEELVARLAAHGIRVTQSTLSRDFKRINVLKTPHPQRGYVYVLGNSIVPEVETAEPETSGNAILGIRFSGNIFLITTKPDYAGVMASIIDNAKSKDILGTVAGNNTIIVVMVEDADRVAVRATLKRIFPTTAIFD